MRVKVLCIHLGEDASDYVIDDTCIELVVGVWYEATQFDTNEYVIRSLTGEFAGWYPPAWFVTEQEHRNYKLEDLLE